MRKILLALIVATVLGSIVGFSITSSGGMTYDTGSPVDGGSTCAGCHNGGSAIPTSTITATPAFGPGNTYVAGTTYTINVACGGYPKYGICLEILNSNTATASDAGTFGAVVTTNCKLVDGSLSGNPTNIVHSAPSGTANKTTFSFAWTAPSSGSVYIYYCVNGVNGNGATSGDKSQTFSMTLTGLASSPSITENTFNASVFPNPAHDFISLNYSLKESSDIKFEIFSMEGKRITSFNYNNQTAGDHLETIKITDLNLTNGIYSVFITAGNDKISKKLIIK